MSLLKAAEVISFGRLVDALPESRELSSDESKRLWQAYCRAAGLLDRIAYARPGNDERRAILDAVDAVHESREKP